MNNNQPDTQLYDVLVIPTQEEIEREIKKQQHDKNIRLCISIFIVSFMGGIICFAIYIDYEMRKELMFNHTHTNDTNDIY